MNRAEIEAVLQLAFIQCEAVSSPLTDEQKRILLQVVTESITNQFRSLQENSEQEQETTNPLDELTPQQRQALLEFVKAQEKENISWKIRLLNDWLHNDQSGAVQFVRDEFGSSWLNRVKPVHIKQYLEEKPSSEPLKLKIGDRIEVSNGLWEWVQDSGPCSRQWFPCTVVRLSINSDNENSYHNCIIRFDNGIEYEIQGIYQWNRYYWRWSPS